MPVVTTIEGIYRYVTLKTNTSFPRWYIDSFSRRTEEKYFVMIQATMNFKAFSTHFVGGYGKSECRGTSSWYLFPHSLLL